MGRLLCAGVVQILLFSRVVLGWRHPDMDRPEETAVGGWCDEIFDPTWPVVYGKVSGGSTSFPNAAREWKGRTSSDERHLGHVCVARGARTKCHRCEDIACGATLNESCPMQLQGLPGAAMTNGAASASDAPFAVGPLIRHRYDFENAERVCVLMVGASCWFGDNAAETALATAGGSGQACAARCWGADQSYPPERVEKGWYWEDKSEGSEPEGALWTVAGGGNNAQRSSDSGTGTEAFSAPFGFRDGVGTAARFQDPHGLAVSAEGYVFVADSGNHAIRRLDPSTGAVVTIAGDGSEGLKGGLGLKARFSNPRGLDVWYDCLGGSVAANNIHRWLDDGGYSGCEMVLVVADSGNHRIREIRGPGLLSGDKNLVAVHTRAGGGVNLPPGSSPSGLADGIGENARFSFPVDVAVDSDGVAYVADHDNYVIRRVTRFGVVRTLAGSVEDRSGTDGPGCKRPCVRGVPGWIDGALHSAAFVDLAAVALGPPDTASLVIADGSRVRRLTGIARAPFAELLEANPDELSEAELQSLQQALEDATGKLVVPGITPGGIASIGRVSTIAGAPAPGWPTEPRSLSTRDGIGSEARFEAPSGVAVTQDGTVYTSDSGWCRIRRIRAADYIAQPLTCEDRLVDVLLPRGCGARDPPLDAREKTVSAHRGNLFYNYMHYEDFERVGVRGNDGGTKGRGQPKTCFGAPPFDRGIRSDTFTIGPHGDTGWQEFEHKEQYDERTTLRFACPSRCGVWSASSSASHRVVGGGSPALGIYADTSPICAAAVHAGVIDDNLGGLVNVTVRRGWGSLSGALAPDPWLIESLSLSQADVASPLPGSTRNGVTSLDASHADVAWAVDPDTSSVARTFTVEAYNNTLVEVETIAGSPAAPLDNPCGFFDNLLQPGASRLRNPRGIAIFFNATMPTDANWTARVGTNVAPVHFPPMDPPTTPPTASTLLDEWNPLGRAPNASASIGHGVDTMDITPGTPESGTLPYLLFIADTGNHAIRALSAVCTKPCENGGVCEGPNLCQCPSGWTGDDCSVADCSSSPCGTREICTGPDTCTCIPGYTGSSCDEPMCVVDCGSNGYCAGPDRCKCNEGWFGPSCRTPVCEQTCGNGGNCTAPDTCTCPEDWTGSDCRTPVCRQGDCVNGNCTAPDTCVCEPGWSGHTCEKPVCHQGFFRPDPRPNSYAPDDWREPSWRMYLPCEYEAWCNTTNEFECFQVERDHPTTPVDPIRNITGRAQSPNTDPSICFVIELNVSAITSFRYEDEYDNVTEYWRRTPITPYGWGPTNTSHLWSSPSESEADRQIALVQYVNMTQGVYVCANGGNCTAPDTCVCAEGWAGFDCRTPICRQGYFDPLLAHPTLNYSVEAMRAASQSVLERNLDGHEWLEALGEYAEASLDEAQRVGGVPQGMYRCSERAVTVWENPTSHSGKYPGLIHEHPNYYSRFMDESRGWPPVHVKTPELGDDTVEGWRRDGWWTTVENARWRHGLCRVDFSRTCPSRPRLVELGGGLDTELPGVGSGDAGRKKFDLDLGVGGGLVIDTYNAFHPRISYDEKRVTSSGRWYEDEGGECIDQVQRGCFNGGTCVGPDTCECPSGWEGHDCSLPVCSQTVESVTIPSGSGAAGDGYGDVGGTLSPYAFDPILPATLVRLDGINVGVAVDDPLVPPALPGDERVVYRKCPNNGNCTLPDLCACEKGWTGSDCTIPICAQDCLNGGTCIAPDTCECQQWDTSLFDTRGHPLFRKDNGDPQLSGWTGFDCGTPICVQAERFVPIDGIGSVQLESTSNDGRSFQGGCDPPSPFTAVSQRTRTSEALCGVENWYQGAYELTWDSGPGSSFRDQGRKIRVNHPNWVFDESYGGTGVDDEAGGWSLGPAVYGEGVYACANAGSCIAPDVCACPDGWTGYDCTVPLCRFEDVSGNLRGCQNGGICAGKDDCDCITSPSLLYLAHPKSEFVKEGDTTGYTADDCSMPICTQGFFDPDCEGVEGGAASAGQGCYRCANGGNCTAPDVCTCPPDWTGFDCRTPVCKQYADSQIISELSTVDPDILREFELDPCGTNNVELWKGVLMGQGNCTAPDTCTCFCRERTWLNSKGDLVEEPWTDPLNRGIPAGFTYGSSDCLDGFEGRLNPDGTFRTCHLEIYVPTWLERNTLTLIIAATVTIIVGSILFVFVRRQLKIRALAQKAKRRATLLSSSERASAMASGSRSGSDSDEGEGRKRRKKKKKRKS